MSRLFLSRNIEGGNGRAGDSMCSAHWLHHKADAEVFGQLMCDVTKVVMGKDADAKVSFDGCFCALDEAWRGHMEKFGRWAGRFHRARGPL
jgi:hypothetical protein